MRNTLRSVGAVLTGIIATVALSTGTDLLLVAAGIFPPISAGLFIPWMLALALTYRILYAVIGAYLTAVFAPQNAMKHAIILGFLGTIASIIGVVVGWDLSQHWYPVALAITALPSAWVGGKLGIARKRVSKI